MEKAQKSRKKWLWLPIALLVLLLVVGGVIGAMLFLSPGEQEQAVLTSEIYWNVDGMSLLDPATGLSTREPAADGLYYIRFAIDGGQVELASADKKLVNRIDQQQALGLVFDDAGLIVDMLDISQITTEIAEDYFVKILEGSTAELNSGATFNGMPLKITITEQTKVYNVSPEATVAGEPAELATMDKLRVYGDKDGNITHIYILERLIKSEVYWRMDRQYNTSTAKTKRQPDENGVYTIPFSCEGERVELKCKDVDIVSAIDKATLYACGWGIVFDEDGYIAKLVDPVLVIPGMKGCATYDIVELRDDGYMKAERHLPGSNVGSVYETIIPAECRVYNVSENAEPIGTPAKLEVGDRILCYEDVYEVPTLCFILNKPVDSPMYYNLERSYKNGETTRTPDGSGYYVFELAVKGKVKSFKTKDKKLASEIDSYSYRCFGLKVNGSIIEDVYNPASVAGYYSHAANMYISSVSEMLFTAESGDGKTTATGLLSENCEIYNICGIGAEVGAKDSLRVNDQIMAYQNGYGEVSHVYILSRKLDYPVYWIYERKYDSTTEQTTRVPDENGYYVYRAAVNGKDTTIKTKSKAMATKIDAFSPQMFTAKVSGGIVKEVYPPQASTGGALRSSWFVVRQISNEEIVTESLVGSGITKLKPSQKLTVYNVSAAYSKKWGEKSSLKVGDQIHALTDKTGEAVVIFIRNRELDLDVFWNYERKYSSTNSQTTREPDADGYYVYNLAVNGKSKQYRTKDKEIASLVDSYAAAFCIKAKGDIIQRVYPATTAKTVKAGAASWYDVIKISGNTVTLKNNIPNSEMKTQTLKFTSKTKIYDVSSYAPSFGAAAKLAVGDRVQCYLNDSDKVSYCFIVLKGTRAAGMVSYCDHCQKQVFWAPWDGDAFRQADHHYYLAGNSTIPAQRSIGNDEGKYDIVLDLNGKTLTSEARSFIVWKGSTFTVMDSVGGGKVITAGSEDINGGNIMVHSGATFNLKGGVFGRIEDGATANQGGVVAVSGTDSVVNMTGGAIEGSTANQGGAVYVSEGTFNMTGGTITGGHALKQGGAAFVTQGTFKMTGGTIDGGHAANQGGNMMLVSSAFNLEGGIIQNGISDNQGGNIYFYQVNQTGLTNGTITGGKAANQGGNIYIYDSIVDMDGIVVANGTVTGTTSADRGGNIYIGSGTLTAKNGKIENGSAPNGGNIAICSSKATFELKDQAVVSGGIATTSGGNVYMSSGKFNMTGGKLEDGKADSGGGLWLYTGCEATLTGGTVSGGTATKGGNIFNQGGTVLAVEQVTIADGSATHGGNIANSGGTTAIAGVVSGGTATNNGGNVYISTGTVEMTGGELKDGKAASGGNLWLYNKTTFVMTNGAINNGTADQGANITAQGGTIDLRGGKINGQVRAVAEAEVKLSGSIIIEKGATQGLHLASGLLVKPGVFTETASICISNPGVFTGVLENADSYLKYFVPFNPTMSIEQSDGALFYGLNPKNINKNAVKMTTDGVFASGGTVFYSCPACSQDVQWMPLQSVTENMNLIDGGHYYIPTGGISNAGSLVIPEGSCCIHLNGQTLTSTVSVFAYQSQAKLSNVNIFGEGTVSGPSLGSIGGNNSMTLYGGTYVDTDSSISMIKLTATTAMLEIYDDVTIQGGKAERGGNIYMENGTVNMYGGTITGGEATNQGGNVYMKGTSTFNISGGTITGGKAGASSGMAGGNIYAYGANAKVNISGTAVVSDGQATNAAGQGGNIALQTNSKLTLTGGSVTGGSAKNGAGIGMSNATLNMQGGTISGAVATNNGGNVYISSGTFTMSGGELKDGQAASGGNLWIYNNVNFTMTGGTISGGNAGKGGNIFSQGGNVTIAAASGSNAVPAVNNGISTTGRNINVAAGTLTIGDNANIEGGVLITKATSVTLYGNAIIKANEGYDLNIAAGISVLDKAGNTMLTTEAAEYTVTYDSDGVINGLVKS